MPGQKPLCVIPARGGSKRLPRKNVMPLAGRPMLAWVVDAARNCGVFDSVVVSTEDDEIAAVAESLGATVHPRPVELAQDLSSSTEVCLDAAGPGVDALVCLQPSSPLISPDDVEAAWTTFTSREADFLVSVTPTDPHYFHWAVEERDGDWQMYFGDQYMRDRLELPPVFRPNGAIKIARLESLRERGNFFGAPLAAYEMSEERSIHVATALDARIAEAILLERLAVR